MMQTANELLAEHFRTAHEIDPTYARLVSEALKAGVKVSVVVASITLQGLGVRGYFKYNLNHENV